MFFTSREKQLSPFAGNFKSKIRKIFLYRCVRKEGGMLQHPSLEVFKDKLDENENIP